MKNNLVKNIQVFLSCIAIILVAVFSFTPLLSYRFSYNEASLNKMLKIINFALTAETEDAEDDIEKLENIDYKYTQIYEYFLDPSNTVVNVAPITFVKAIPDTVTVFRSFMDLMEMEDAQERMQTALSENNNGAYTSAQNTYLECREKLKNIDYDAVTINSLTNVFLLFSSMFDEVQDKDLASYTMDDSVLLATLLVIKGTVFVAFTVFFPISMIFAVFKLLGAIFKKRTDIRMGKAIQLTNKSFSWVGYMLALIALWSAELTSFGKLVLITGCVTVALNIIASRFKIYNKKETCFLNCMQVTSAISLTGIIIFAVNIIKLDIIELLTSDAIKNAIRANESEDSFSLATYLIIAIAIILPIIFSGIISMATRLACMKASPTRAGSTKGGIGAGYATFFGLLLLILNFIMFSKYDIEISNSYFTLACVGIGIALVGAILMKVLKGSLASGISFRETQAVLAGTTTNDLKESDNDDDFFDDEEDE